MTPDKYLFIAAYLAAVNLIGMIITVRDKKLAKISGARRIPEKTIFFWALLGGAPAIYLTMLKIRHKTRHKRFMIGIPMIMLLHLLILAGAWYFSHAAENNISFGIF